MQGTNQPHSTDEPRQGHPHQENLDLLNHPEMYLNLLSNKIKRRKADSEQNLLCCLGTKRSKCLILGHLCHLTSLCRLSSRITSAEKRQIK